MSLSYDEAHSSITVPAGPTSAYVEGGLGGDRAGKIKGEIFQRIIDHGNLLDCHSILRGISKVPLEIWIKIFKYVYLSEDLLWPRPQDSHFIPQNSDDRYQFEPRIYDGVRKEIMPTAFGLVVNHHIYSSIEFAFESFEECFSFLVGVPLYVRSRIRRIVLRPYLCSGSFTYEYFHRKDWLDAHRQYVRAGMIDEKSAELNSVSCHIMQLLEANRQFERLTFQVFSPDLEWSPGDTEITKEDRVETFISDLEQVYEAVSGPVHRWRLFNIPQFHIEVAFPGGERFDLLDDADALASIVPRSSIHDTKVIPILQCLQRKLRRRKIPSAKWRMAIQCVTREPGVADLASHPCTRCRQVFKPLSAKRAKHW